MLLESLKMGFQLNTSTKRRYANVIEIQNLKIWIYLFIDYVLSVRYRLSGTPSIAHRGHRSDYEGESLGE